MADERAAQEDVKKKKEAAVKKAQGKKETQIRRSEAAKRSHRDHKRRSEAAKRSAVTRKRKRQEVSKAKEKEEMLRQQTLEILGTRVEKTIKEVVGAEVVNVVKEVCDVRFGDLDGTLKKLAAATQQTTKVMTQCCDDVTKLKTELQQVKVQATSYMQSRPMFNPSPRYNPGRGRHVAVGPPLGRPSASNHPAPIAGTTHSLMERSFRDFMRDMMLREQFY